MMELCTSLKLFSSPTLELKPWMKCPRRNINLKYMKDIFFWSGKRSVNIVSPSSESHCPRNIVWWKQATYKPRHKCMPLAHLLSDLSLENFPDKSLKGVPQPDADSFCQRLCLKIMMTENPGIHQPWYFEVIGIWKSWGTNHSNNIRITSWMVFFILKASFTRASKKAHVSRKSTRKRNPKLRKFLTSHSFTTSSHKQQGLDSTQNGIHSMYRYYPKNISMGRHYNFFFLTVTLSN